MPWFSPMTVKFNAMPIRISHDPGTLAATLARVMAIIKATGVSRSSRRSVVGGRRVERPRHVPRTGCAGGTCPDVPSDLPAGPDRESEGDEPTEGVQDPAHAHGDPPFFHDRLYTFHFAPAAISSEANVAPESRMRLIFARIEPPPDWSLSYRTRGVHRPGGWNVGRLG